MSNSKLATIKVPAYTGNYTKGRSGKKITKITIHHMAGVLSAEQCGKEFQKKGRNGSSHYGVGKNGEIGLYVDEKNTAWTDSNWKSNCTSVTIETSNNKRGGNWTVGDKALKSLIKLCADIAKRNKLGKLVKGKNLTWHSMYYNTTCPGNYLRSKMQYICDEANKINYPPTPKPEPKPEPAPTPKPKVNYYKRCSSKYTSLVDALKSIKVNSSFANRFKIAKKNGIKLYVGTSKQNIKLLDLLKKGKLVK